MTKNKYWITHLCLLVLFVVSLPSCKRQISQRGDGNTSITTNINGTWHAIRYRENKLSLDGKQTESEIEEWEPCDWGLSYKIENGCVTSIYKGEGLFDKDEKYVECDWKVKTNNYLYRLREKGYDTREEIVYVSDDIAIYRKATLSTESNTSYTKRTAQILLHEELLARNKRNLPKMDTASLPNLLESRLVQELISEFPQLAEKNNNFLAKVSTNPNDPRSIPGAVGGSVGIVKLGESIGVGRILIILNDIHFWRALINVKVISEDGRTDTTQVLSDESGFFVLEGLPQKGQLNITNIRSYNIKADQFHADYIDILPDDGAKYISTTEIKQIDKYGSAPITHFTTNPEIVNLNTYLFCHQGFSVRNLSIGSGGGGRRILVTSTREKQWDISLYSIETVSSFTTARSDIDLFLPVPAIKLLNHKNYAKFHNVIKRHSKDIGNAYYWQALHSICNFNFKMAGQEMLLGDWANGSPSLKYKIKKFESLANASEAMRPQGNRTEAIKLVERAEISDRSQKEVLLSLYTAAIKADPTYAPAYYERSQIYFYFDTSKALIDLNKAISLFEFYQDALYERALLFSKLSMNEEFLRDIDKLIDLFPFCKLYIRTRAKHYYANSDYLKALSDYNASHEIDTNDTSTLSGRAQTLRQIGQYDKAVEDYEALINKAPHWTHMMQLAQILSSAPDSSVWNPDRAITLSLEALEKTKKENPYVMNTLAAAYARAGKYLEAQKWQLMSLELLENNDHKILSFRRLRLYMNGRPYTFDQ